MWPFDKKLIQHPKTNVGRQVAAVIKSVSLPEASATWRLFAKHDHNWNTEVAINEGYNASAVVYACVEKRAKLISSVPWKANIIKADGTKELAPNSPLQLLLDNPNPELSMLELTYSISQMMDLSGSAFISEIKAGARNLPTQLWVLPSQFMKIKPGKERLVDHFEYQEYSAKKFTIEADDMIQLKNPNPNSRYFGMPVLMSAGRATDIDREAGEWQKRSFENRGVTDLHVEVPSETSAEDAKAIQEAIIDRNGGNDNARKPLVTSGKVNILNTSAVEMDFANSKNKIWGEITAAFGMSLSDLGLTENVNLSNAETMLKQLWTNTIIPQLDLIKAQLNKQLASEFGAEFCIEYDLSNIRALQENYGEKLDNAIKLKAIGFDAASINERLELGFDGDQLPVVQQEPVVDEIVVSEDEAVSTAVKKMMSKITYGS
jgi:HK97 family phage portal protein